MHLFAERPGRAVVPFAAVAVAGLLTVLLPPYADDPAKVGTALGGVAAVLVLSVAVLRLPRTHWAVGLPPLLFFVVVAWGRDATGGSTSGLGPLVLLPILWIILYGTRVQLWLAAVATGLVFIGPLLLVGGPGYAVSDWRRGVLWFAVVVVVCPSLQRAVEQLRASTAEQARLARQLGSVLQAATEHAIVATDRDGTITLFSEGAERLLGYRAQDVVGRATPAVFHDPREVAARAAELGVPSGLDAVLRGGPGATWTYLRRDGARRRVRLTVTALGHDDGGPTGWIGVAHDVTAEEHAQQGLAAAERRWRTLLEHLPDTSVLVVGPDLDYRVAVGAGLPLHGMAGVEGRTVRDSAVPDVGAQLEPLCRSALDGTVGRGELRSGGDTVAEVVAVPLPRRDGEREALVVARDVTEARRRETELATARDRFEYLFDSSPHGVLLLDGTGAVGKVNPAFCRLVGMTAADMLGVPVRELPFTAGGEPSLLEPLLNGTLTHLSLDRTLHRPDGEVLHVTIAVVGLHGPGHPVDALLVTVVDLSERRRYEAQLARLADHDPLTGLVNRRRFDAELVRHLAHCRRYGPTGAVLMIDLDHFKQVNDTLGHSAGDELILSVAAVLRRRLRDSDVVARLGGDEFAVLLPVAGRDDAETVARDIVQMVRDEVTVLDGTRPHLVTTSVGVVLINDADTGPGELLSTADMTMYDAKDAGRDRYVLHDTDRFAVPRSSARIAWARRIGAALADGTLVVHAQPVLDLRTGAVTGAELLVRMTDDTGALIMPGTFLYIAERTDLITQIDMFMIGRAVQVLEEAQRIVPGFSIEVNLSGRSVGDPRVARHITRVLAEHDVDPRGLVLEITETTAVSNIEVARGFAETIRLLGCRFALDDFGAGFGSFYYLKHLLFDFVKIDGEFVANCPTNPVDQLIITSIVTIARGLGKETIAEFVTDPEVLRVVRSLGVDHAQGYHVGRPEPVADLLARVRALGAADRPGDGR